MQKMINIKPLEDIQKLIALFLENNKSMEFFPLIKTLISYVELIKTSDNIEKKIKYVRTIFFDLNSYNLSTTSKRIVREVLEEINKFLIYLK